MGDGRRGEEEKERWKRKGGSEEEEGRTVGTFEWLSQWITKPFASLVFTPSFIPTPSKLRLEDAARCRSKPAYPLSSS